MDYLPTLETNVQTKDLGNEYWEKKRLRKQTD